MTFTTTVKGLRGFSNDDLVRARGAVHIEALQGTAFVLFLPAKHTLDLLACFRDLGGGFIHRYYAR